MSGNTVCVCTLSLVKYLSSVSLFDIFVGEKVLPCLFNTQCCKLSKGHTGFHVVHISSTCLCIYKQAFIFWHLFMKVWTERAVIKYFIRPTQDFFFFLRLAWTWQHLLRPGWHRGTWRSGSITPANPSHLIASETEWEWKTRGQHGGTAEPGQRWVTFSTAALSAPDFTRTVPVLQCQCSQCFTVLLVWLWSTWNNSYTKTLIPPVVIWVLPSAYHLYSCTLGVLTPISKLPFCGQTPISLTYLLTQIFISTSES